MGSPFSRSASWGEHNDVEVSAGCRPPEAARWLGNRRNWSRPRPGVSTTAGAALAEGYAPRASREGVTDDPRRHRGQRTRAGAGPPGERKTGADVRVVRVDRRVGAVHPRRLPRVARCLGLRAVRADGAGPGPVRRPDADRDPALRRQGDGCQRPGDVHARAPAQGRGAELRTRAAVGERLGDGGRRAGSAGGRRTRASRQRRASVPIELLLADNSHAHLSRMATSSPTGEPPNCSVDSPDQCPAARRAQVQRFSDSEALDACPKLRARPQGRCAAICVPVSIMGRTVGVIHATCEPNTSLDDAAVQDLETLAKLAGARIGLLRVMTETSSRLRPTA